MYRNRCYFSFACLFFIVLGIVFSYSSMALATQIGPLLNQDLQINTTTATSPADTAEVAFDGSRYLIVWVQVSDLSFYFHDIYGRFVDKSGNMSSPFLIAHKQLDQNSPSVAFNGTNYLVVWWTNAFNRINGQLVSPSGNLIGTEIPIADIDGTQLRPEVASDGKGFLVVWDDGRDTSTSDRDIFGQFVEGDGSLIGANFLISPGPEDQSSAAVAFGNSQYLVTWTNKVSINTPPYDVYGALVSPYGTVSPSIPISTAAGNQGFGEAGISFGGGNFLVVFDNDGGPAFLMGMRLSEAGVLLDGPPEAGGFAISNSLGGAPAVAFDGTNWLVLASGGNNAPSTRVSLGGIVLDPTGMESFLNVGLAFDPAVAFDGTNFLVTARTYMNPKSKYAQLVGEIIQPIANAGPDTIVNEGQLVTLDGTGSIGVDPLTFTWQQVAGPSVTLSGINTVNPTFTAPFVPIGGATLTFELTVTDASGTSSPDVVNINVKNVNNPPVADAGPDQTVTEGSPVMLDSSGSFDNDAEALTFNWVQTAGTLVTLSDPTAVKPTFTAPLVGLVGETLTFQLTVSDGIDQNSDAVNVFITEPNNPPVADAGPDQTVDEGTPVTLDGSGSSDPDSDPLMFTWGQVLGAPVILSGTNTINPTFTAPLVPPGGETLVFQLTISDGDLSNTDQVSVTVLNVNDPPACDLAQVVPDFIWPPNHKLVSAEITGVTDPDNDQVSIVITGVTQDEALNGLGDGDSSPDAVIQNGTALLRAERAGNDNGRVYNLAFSADDGFGGSCSGTVTVCVPHDRRNACVDDGQNFDSTQP